LAKSSVSGGAAQAKPTKPTAPKQRLMFVLLGAEFLDRGPALNTRQLQLRLGTGEIHFTETPHPAPTASSHFALEIDVSGAFTVALNADRTRLLRAWQEPVEELDATAELELLPDLSD
jgi:hypothetical protein